MDDINTAFDECEQAGLDEQIRAMVAAVDVGNYPQTEDEQTLCRYLKARMHLVAELTRVQEQMQAMVRTLESRLNQLDYIYLPIVQPITARLLERGKAKSVKTPWGTVGFRATQTSLRVVDEEQLLKTAPPNWVKTTRSIIKSAINDHFKETGEVPDGVEVIPAGEKFYAK